MFVTVVYFYFFLQDNTWHLNGIMCGSGTHFRTMVKIRGTWFLYDDIRTPSLSDVQETRYFGNASFPRTQITISNIKKIVGNRFRPYLFYYTQLNFTPGGTQILERDEYVFD